MSTDTHNIVNQHLFHAWDSNNKMHCVVPVEIARQLESKLADAQEDYVRVLGEKMRALGLDDDQLAKRYELSANRAGVPAEPTDEWFRKVAVIARIWPADNEIDVPIEMLGPIKGYYKAMVKAGLGSVADAKLREALQKYGGHLGACAGGEYSKGALRCDCGYAEAKAMGGEHGQ